MKTQNKFFAIIGALDAEINEYIKHLKNPKKNIWKQFIFHEGELCGKQVVIIKSGVGKVFAAMTAQKLIDTYNPECIMFTGVAGGLNNKFKIGDIIISKDSVQYDLNAIELGFSRGTIPYTNLRFFETDAKLRALALVAKTQHTIYEGRILTGDQFLTKKNIREYNYLVDELKGDAVDMESAAIGQVCTLNDVPFLIIRTISDKADGNASINFNKFLPEVTKNSFSIIQHILKEYK